MWYSPERHIEHLTEFAQKYAALATNDIELLTEFFGRSLFKRTNPDTEFLRFPMPPYY